MARPFLAPRGALSNYKKFGDEPLDHAIGRSRGGLTTKNHLVCDGKGRALAFILTPGQAADTSMLSATLSEIRVPGARGRPRSRPDRVLADKGYPSRANRAWLRERGIAATIPERDDQITHRRKRRGRPIDFGDQQRARYRGRNVVERCFNKLKQWRGIAMRSDKLARNYHAGLCLAATLHWISTPALWPPALRAALKNQIGSGEHCSGCDERGSEPWNLDPEPHDVRAREREPE